MEPRVSHAILLAGGVSRRMGRDKALLPLGDGTVGSTLAAALRRVFPSVHLVTNRIAGHAGIGLPMIEDFHPGRGPLAGIEAAFRRVPAEAFFFIPVDMPRFPPEAIRALCEIGVGAPGACYRFAGRIEPLPCVLTRSWWEGVEGKLWESEGSSAPGLKRHFERGGMKALDGDALAAEFPGVFGSLNTPDDYRRWRDRISAAGAPD